MVDVALDIRKNCSKQRMYLLAPVNKAPSAAFCGNSTTMSHPGTYTLGPSNRSNTDTTKVPIIGPRVQTFLEMLPVTHTILSNYHVNRYPVMNNSNATEVTNSVMFTPTHIHAQRPILLPLVENSQCANKFSNTWPAAHPANHKTAPSLPTLPIQTASILKACVSSALFSFTYARAKFRQ
jgi:hypothetical protein